MMNKHTVFGRTGESVSWLGMGGMRFEKGIPERECVSSIRSAHERGVSYFDTAPIYNEDRSEEIYGRAFREMNREQFRVATKAENRLTAQQVQSSIDRSLKRLHVEQIDFYFLWCIITPGQFDRAQESGRSLEGIMKARDAGKIKHAGVSAHMYSKDLMTLIDSELFDFIMVPFNALNFRQRSEALKHAHRKGLGTVVMNPLYGGLIPEFNDRLKIFPGSTKTATEDALLFCYESPYINVTLAGMNRPAMIEKNIEVLQGAEKCSWQEQDRREAAIDRGMPDMCTSCGYCLRHCPEHINIRSYMEIYNTYMLTGSREHTGERNKWYHNFGPLQNTEKMPADCTGCLACEEECTQYLNITGRLNWLDEQFHK